MPGRTIGVKPSCYKNTLYSFQCLNRYMNHTFSRLKSWRVYNHFMYIQRVWILVWFLYIQNSTIKFQYISSISANCASLSLRLNQLQWLLILFATIRWFSLAHILSSVSVSILISAKKIEMQRKNQPEVTASCVVINYFYNAKCSAYNFNHKYV